MEESPIKGLTCGFTRIDVLLFNLHSKQEIVDFERREPVAVCRDSDIGCSAKAFAVQHQGIVDDPVLDFFGVEPVDGLEVVPV